MTKTPVLTLFQENIGQLWLLGQGGSPVAWAVGVGGSASGVLRVQFMTTTDKYKYSIRYNVFKCEIFNVRPLRGPEGQTLQAQVRVRMMTVIVKDFENTDREGKDYNRDLNRMCNIISYPGEASSAASQLCSLQHMRTSSTRVKEFRESANTALCHRFQISKKCYFGMRLCSFVVPSRYMSSYGLASEDFFEPAMKSSAPITAVVSRS